MSGFDSEPKGKGKSSSGGERPRVVKRSFNPMGSYFYFLTALILCYGVFFLFGYSLVVILMLYFVVLIFHEVSYVVANVTYGLARKAAYLNALISSLFFSIFTINSFGITRYGYQFILPGVENLTSICPLFVMLGLLGCRNIRLMYGPSEL